MEVTSSPPPTASRTDPERLDEQCESCGSPVASDQRYCVECGTHRRYVHDPAAQYMRSRAGHRGAVSRTRSVHAVRRPPSLALVALMAVVPLAVGLGVLVGRASTNGDAKLIAALRAQRPEIINAGGGGATATATAVPAASTPLSSTFPFQSGWAVELQALPAARATRSSVSAAERADLARGAPAVGLILPSDFRITPSPARGAVVIYSGAYRSRSAAERALARLRRHFGAAEVIQVQSSRGGAPATGGGKALSTTVYGTAHQIAGSQVTSGQLAAGSQVVKHIQQTQGKSYVNAQRGLPDQISIP